MSEMIRMPYDGKNVPHIVIEVNQQCNIICKACYKDKYGMTKPLDKVKEEIDFAISRRKLSAVTLAGGEPILHPQLNEIISYITNKGIMVQMLSNGFALTPEKLEGYKRCGLKEIFLHIDKHQTRPDFPENVRNEMDLNPLRDKIGKMIKDSGIAASLEITLYQSSLPELDEFMEYVLSSPLFTRLLVTCCTDFDKLAFGFKKANVLEASYENPNANDSAGPSPLVNEVFNPEKEVIERFKRSLQMEPFGYVASSESDKSMRWVFYYSFSIIDKNGRSESLHLDDGFNNLVRFSNWSSIRSDKPLSFGRILDQKSSLILLSLYALTSFKFKTAFKTAKFLTRLLKPGSKIFHKSFTYQLTGPTLNADGSIEYCKDCPDATVRDGKLVPVCMADILSPINKAHKVC